MPLHLFFDESGDFNFRPTGSRYCLFGVLSTFDLAPINAALIALRYQLLEEGTALERFHAAEDLQSVRDRAFTALRAVGEFQYDVVVLEKRKVEPALCTPAALYPHFAGMLLEQVFRRHDDPADDVILVTDTLPVKKQRKAVEKTFKQTVRQRFEDRRFAIHHNSSIAHPGLQAADYCTWAVYRKYQRGDLRSYDLISAFIRSEVDVFAAESVTYC